MRKMFFLLFVLLIYSMPCSAENIYLSEDYYNVYYLDTDSVVFAGRPILTLPSEPDRAKVGIIIVYKNSHYHEPQTIDEVINPTSDTFVYANMMIYLNMFQLRPITKPDKDILGSSMSIELYISDKVFESDNAKTTTTIDGPKKLLSDGSIMQDHTIADKSGPLAIYDNSIITYSTGGIRLMADWFLTIKQYIDTHNWAIMERTKKFSDNIITTSDVDPSNVDLHVKHLEQRTIPKSTIEWTLYKTINLTPGNQVKITIPATQWQIIPASLATQFTIKGEDILYINRTGRYENTTISSCLPGTYTITPETSGEIKIMIAQ
jgi:hypothetical protein